MSGHLKQNDSEYNTLDKYPVNENDNASFLETAPAYSENGDLATMILLHIFRGLNASLMLEMRFVGFTGTGCQQ